MLVRMRTMGMEKGTRKKTVTEMGMTMLIDQRASVASIWHCISCIVQK
jgi:hypothetical protein